MGVQLGDLYQDLPIAPIDVKMFLFDRTSDDNFLLDGVDFDPQQIRYATQWCVDKFNEMTPLTGVYDKLPRMLWITGTASILLRMRAINQSRNRLDYEQRNGVAVQDKNKFKEYLELSKMLQDEFEASARRLKINQNIESAYGRLESMYRDVPGTGT